MKLGQQSSSKKKMSFHCMLQMEQVKLLIGCLFLWVTDEESICSKRYDATSSNAFPPIAITSTVYHIDIDVENDTLYYMQKNPNRYIIYLKKTEYGNYKCAHSSSTH